MSYDYDWDSKRESKGRRLLVKWNSQRNTINALKAVRAVFGLRFAEAKAALDNKSGFLVTGLQWLALKNLYLLSKGTYAKDWTVVQYKTETAPADFTGFDPFSDPLEMADEPSNNQGYIHYRRDTTNKSDDPAIAGKTLGEILKPYLEKTFAK